MTQVWSATQLNASLTGGGTTIVTQGGSATESIAYGSESVVSGKYYWESAASKNASNGGNSAAGIGTTVATTGAGQFPGFAADTVGVYAEAAILVLAIGGVSTTYTQTNTDGDRIANAFDVGNKLFWAKNLTQGSPWYGATNSGDPASGTGGFNVSTIVGVNPNVPLIGIFANGETGTGYFAQASWLGAAPSGFAPFDVPPTGHPSSITLLGVGGTISIFPPANALVASIAWRLGNALRRNPIVTRRFWKI